MKHNNQIKISEELVRIHAHLCGDGGVYFFKTSENDRINRAEIAYYNTNEALISTFRNDMGKLFGIKMTYSQKKSVVHVFSIRIAQFLTTLSEYGARKWRIPDSIKTSPRKYKVEWIKAFSLDEGYLPTDRRCIRIKSMNLLGLGDAKEMLDSLNIHSNLTGPNCDKSYYLNIRMQKELANFSKTKSRK
ncbi:hypothetical protein KY328_01975 [Candidatus Woesearchaeota archaeon]|nr:hypothetical protein [Candidatus Woesearchaeota archaeon]MBW3021664.1 hypothetical protein [Candidatus Woesearchaeota archaeon]